ncbi:hypothetical protein EDD68_11820 [Melghiribacillus thermohalophilus]|uniref:Uncharacterized protein n=1 Tax=Melghiribacillus thermohalophilus TaxID=1324956 RepID=A0A4R3MUC2_9BACI|nr:hypothetical protein [Melghiribacillus thermohalophilus]TCT19337.1 hypothetical protein EDD68_11820 [Melghiribacillus thermohalophilus]
MNAIGNIHPVEHAHVMVSSGSCDKMKHDMNWSHQNICRVVYEKKPECWRNIKTDGDHGMENNEYYVGWGTLALINAGLAQGKNRSGLNWFFISLLLGPFATLILLVQEKLPEEDS